MKKLLSRCQFRDFALQRDKQRCVFCNKPATSVHHILDRKLFCDGGYYLDNAASVCDEHHWAVEKTDISVPDVYKACSITDPALPDGFSPGIEYDKWGNEVIDIDMRIAGPMFDEPGVQKILKDKLHYFD